MIRPALILLGAVIVFAAVVASQLSRRERKSEAARRALYDARKSLITEIKNLARPEIPGSALDAPPALPEAKDNKNSKEAKKTPEQEASEKKAREERALGEASEKLAYRQLDVDSKFPEGVKKLKAVGEEFKGTHSGFEAVLALGNLYADHGDPGKAEPWFEKAAREAPGKLEKTMAFAAVGLARESQGKNKEALESFEMGLKSAEGNIKADLLLAMGRTHQRLSNAPKAKDAYDQVISHFPGSESAKTAEIQKAQLE